MLEEYTANRIFENTLPKHGQVKPNTVLSYLSALKFYHIDKQFSLKGFENPQMAFIIRDRRGLFSSTKQNQLPITKKIYEKIIKAKLFQ